MTTKNNLLASINSRIEGISKSATAFKADLAAVVRELLVYVPDSGDIGAVNRLIAVLNKTDRTMVVSFFRAFLPWKFALTQTGQSLFTSKSKNNPRVAAMTENITNWLKDENNNIWDWQKQTRPRPELSPNEARKAVATRITNAIERAISAKTADGKAENKAKLTPELIVRSIMDAGISLEDIMEVVNKALEVRKAEQAKLEEEEAKLKANTANENVPKPKATRKAAAGK